MKLWLLFAWVLGASPLLAKELCPPATIADLKAQLAEKPATELIFFASWCVSCKEHLTKTPAGGLLVASFDERAAANKIVEHFAGADAEPRCVWDQDGSIAAFYQVKGLPAKRSLGPSP